MKALLAAEMLKLRSTRTTAGLLLATLGLVALTVGSEIPKVGAAEGPLSLDDPDLLADVVATCFGIPQLLMVLYGTIAVTQEFRYGTITSTYLGEPRRSRILVAKWIALALVGAVICIATLALSVSFSIALIRSRGGDVTLAGHFWGVVAVGFVVLAAYGVIGVAIGALVRNQVAAVVGVIVFMTAIEFTVVPTFPEVGRWFPLGATSAMFQSGPSLGLDGELLSAPVAGLVLLGYTAAAVVLALRITPRRDVL
ncbi:MAG TPA: ABC transporter permease subunit [Nocardioidaceae bacterium]|nr:ABC transporter permease subunit [Nocardioidaceae bacterium]